LADCQQSSFNHTWKNDEIVVFDPPEGAHDLDANDEDPAAEGDLISEEALHYNLCPSPHLPNCQQSTAKDRHFEYTQYKFGTGLNAVEGDVSAYTTSTVDSWGQPPPVITNVGAKDGRTYSGLKIQ